MNGAGRLGRFPLRPLDAIFAAPKGDPAHGKGAVVDAMLGAGVVPVRLEALSLAAQVALFRQAELVNLVFARPGRAALARRGGWR